MMQRIGWLMCAGGLAMLGGCVQTPSKGHGEAVALNALYAQLDQATTQYADALDQARRGDVAQSDKTLETALDAMRNSADRCVNTEGCDAQRFLSAYDRALRLKDGSFLGTEDASSEPSDNLADAGPGMLATVPEAGRTAALLPHHTLADLVASNDAVQAAIEVWLSRKRADLIRAHVEYQYLRHRMWPAFKSAGLPEAVLFGIMAKESGGNVHAVSRSGAAGPLQFMPATGSRFGLDTVAGFDQRFDPAMSAAAGAEYINEQLGRLNDDLALVLAAYNGGESRMVRMTKGMQNPSLWNPDVYASLSPETREYVPMVLAAAWLFLHPQRYNLHFPRVEDAPGQVQLVKPMSLNEITVCLGDDDGARYGWYRTLRNLNPKLDPDDLQPAGTVVALPRVLEATYRRACTSGPWATLAEQLRAAQLPAALANAPSDPPRGRRYTVRRGDTLSAIARRFRCPSIHDLAASNRLLATSGLQIGQKLRIDGCRR